MCKGTLEGGEPLPQANSISSHQCKEISTVARITPKKVVSIATPLKNYVSGIPVGFFFQKREGGVVTEMAVSLIILKKIPARYGPKTQHLRSMKPEHQNFCIQVAIGMLQTRHVYFDNRNLKRKVRHLCVCVNIFKMLAIDPNLPKTLTKQIPSVA